MLPEYTPAELSTRWQREIGLQLEAGQNSAFHLGYDFQLVDHAQGLLALRMLAAQRLDLSRPSVIAGGTGPLWLDLLLDQPAPPNSLLTPPLHVIYGGADMATVLASRTLYADGSRSLRKAAYRQPPAGLPNAFVDQLAPRAAPSPATEWNAYPLWEIDRAQVGRKWAMPEDEDWLAYATIMLAVLLLLAAIVLSVMP